MGTEIRQSNPRVATGPLTRPANGPAEGVPSQPQSAVEAGQGTAPLQGERAAISGGALQAHRDRASAEQALLNTLRADEAPSGKPVSLDDFLAAFSQPAEAHHAHVLADVAAPSAGEAKTGTAGAIFQQQYARIAEAIQNDPKFLAAFDGTSAPASNLKEAQASWVMLSDEERPAVAQKLFTELSEVVGKVYGFTPAPFELSSTPGCLGVYDRNTGKIAIDAASIGQQPLGEVMNAFVHEQTHAYQKHLADTVDSLGGSPELQAAAKTFKKEMGDYFLVPESLTTAVRSKGKPLSLDQLKQIARDVVELPQVSPEVTSAIEAWKTQAKANFHTPERMTQANKALFKVLYETYRSQLVESQAMEAGQSVSHRVLGD